MKWFKHETDAHTNLKLQTVIDTYGLEAFGYYWICVELVALQSENFKLKAEKNWKNYLKKLSGLTQEQQEPYLQLFAETKLIDKKALKKGTLSIPKLAERCDEYTEKKLRKSRQYPDNVLLEEKRKEENRTEEIKPERSVTFLSEIPEPILTELSEEFKVSPQGVKAKAKQLKNYCESKGKKYKNYKSFLSNALDKDKIQLQQQFPYTKPATPPPKQEEIPPEEQAKIEARKAAIRANLRPTVAT
jgi:hypothetical protein